MSTLNDKYSTFYMCSPSVVTLLSMCFQTSTRKQIKTHKPQLTSASCVCNGKTSTMSRWLIFFVEKYCNRFESMYKYIERKILWLLHFVCNVTKFLLSTWLATQYFLFSPKFSVECFEEENNQLEIRSSRNASNVRHQ